jgi:hypothetical protein
MEQGTPVLRMPQLVGLAHYWITSSAASKRPSGTSIPNSFAVVRVGGLATKEAKNGFF